MTSIKRRDGLVLALGSAAAGLLAGSAAWAQPARGRPRDWLVLVRQHHRLIARSFDELLAPNDASYERRNLQLRNVDQLLTAHSLAEETVLYPALAMEGLQSEAEKLYMEEAHFKIGLARLELATAGRRQGRDWVAPARALRDAVLQHAREDEEDRLFPELRRRLTAERNRALAAAYTREFSRVIPATQR